MKLDWKKILPHAVAVSVFLIVAMIYMYPALQGYRVSSHDIDMHKGMSKEVFNHRAEYGEEPLWTNSMFGGMPATQISVVYDSNLVAKIQKGIFLGLPHPVNYLFLYMVGFYILLMCLKVDPWLALVGALAYGFSSYFFIIMGAGHNSKAVAVGYMAPALGGFLLTFRKRYLLGIALTTLFLSLQINANHPQVTYYFFILLFFIFIYEAIKFVQRGEGKSLLVRTGLLAIGVALAISTNVPNLYGTYEYSPYTQRGGSELTPIDTTKKDEKGMSKDYALQWSYGKSETWSFLIPNINGGPSNPVLANKDIMENPGNDELKQILNVNYQFYSNRTSPLIKDYFGNQASTSGPVYIGAVVCLLFLLAMVFWTGKLKWPILIMTILSIGLAWGKNLSWLTNLFWDHVPVYKNFRAVTIILVIVELAFPLVAILWLKDVYANRDKYKEKIKFFWLKQELNSKVVFFSTTGFLLLVSLLFAAAPGSFLELESEDDKTIFQPQYLNQQMLAMVSKNPQDVPAEYQNNLQEYAGLLANQYRPYMDTAREQLREHRVSIVQKDALRTFLFLLLAGALLYFFLYGNFNSTYFSLALGCLMLVDLWGVATRYLNNDSGKETKYEAWVEEEQKLIPFSPTFADAAILQNEVNANPEIGVQINNALIANKKEKGEELTLKENFNTQFGVLGQMTDYRVFLLNPGYSQETSISYYHKSLGGYHSAKIQRYQDFIERKMNRQMQLASNPSTLKDASILNMLNTKYIVLNPGGEGQYLDMNDPSTFSEANQKITPGFINNEALGNAWFISKITAHNSPDEEFAALDNIDVSSEAITDENYEHNSGITGDYTRNEGAKIDLVNYKANELIYSVEGATGGDHYAVFSEIYYPLGWKAYVDGKETEINRVNYTFRGVKIPEGAKEVILRYELASFAKLSTFALISSSLIILLVIGLGYLSLVKKKDA